eukprot:Em0006g1017a
MLRQLIIIGVTLLSGSDFVSSHLEITDREANPYDHLLWPKVATVDLDSSMYFDVTPTQLSTSGEWVTVYWSGVSSPSSKDSIAVYSPPASNGYGVNTSTAPIKYQYASSSSTHTSYGSGQLKFRLINMREKVVFGFFQGSSLKAVSSVVEFSNYNEPLQGHLALTSDTTSMTVMWTTKEALSPTVMWGTESNNYEASASAETKTYSAKNMCGAPATGYGYRDPGLLHTATMTDLEPGYTYYYSFGDEYGYSPEYSFKAPPAADSDSTITVVAFGDMGVAESDGSYLVETSKYSLNTTSRIKAQLSSLDIVLHIGDITYALGYSSMWEVYFDQIQQIATSVPFMVAIGNHERNWPYTSPGTFNNSGSGGECGIPHEMRFPMPTPARDSPWYSFNYGSAHFIVMSTEHSFQKGSSQYSYIYSDLKSVNKTNTPWIIFAGHRPMYVASKDSDYPDGHTVVAQSLRYALEPLFQSYGVDLALWAHIHGYQRTCSVYQGSCYSSGSSSSKNKGTTHVVVGMAGRTLHNNILPSSMPSWLVYYDLQNYGYSRMNINMTHLVFQYVHNYDNKVYDSFVLKKNTT